MGLFSAKTIISSLALFHITIGFFFLTSPGTIAEQSLVHILGDAMGLPEARSFDIKSDSLAFLAAVLLVFGISDLIAVSLPEEIGHYHWGSQAPVRLMVFLGLVIYSYSFSASSPLYDPSTYRESSWGEGLKNRVLFSWAFLEMVTWFWAYSTLREERREFLMREARRKADEDMM
ncbi:increased loss of mitochondrial DNA protein 1 [Xylogone sp. PMI_703]|nr:increased loss of mitochondrial DNA protein 1 [Xylogone sp. PMI_703]